MLKQSKVKKILVKTRHYFRSLVSPSYIIKNAEKLMIENKTDQALNVLRRGIRFHPKNYKINKMAAKLFKEKKDWRNLIIRLEEIQKFKEYEKSLDTLLEVSMIYTILGRHAEADNLFDNIMNDYKDEIQNDDKGYRKLIVYDNGESRIEFYKKLKQTKSVMVTFDAINMVWGKPSFAFKILQKENVDIIAIRKRLEKTYQQDLHQENFTQVVKPILNNYTDKMAYGFSLGAYHTLYFASLLDCRILAISPRLSIHPIYGRKKIIPNYKMKHKVTLSKNKNIAPIIVYDPQNALDKYYIEEGILPRFPNAILIKIPYGGHGLAPQMLQMGILKEFVLSFMNNTTPIYHKNNRKKSHAYFTNLATKCFKRNKFKWSLHLVNQALVIKLNDKKNVKLKIDTLKKMDKEEEVIVFLESLINKYPRILTYRNWLFDSFLALEKTDNATEVLKKSILDFGDSRSIQSRKIKLSKFENENKEISK